MYKIIGADLKEYGPITADQVKQWIREGRLNAVSKIQAEGSNEWKAVRDFPEFAPLVAPVPSAINLGPAAKAPPATNHMATASLVVGIPSLIPCCGVILAPIAIVLGAIALSELKKNPGQGGRGLAIAGIILGSLGLLINGFLFSLSVLFPGAFQLPSQF